MEFSKENWKPDEYEEWLELDLDLIGSLISDDKIVKALNGGVPESFAPFSSFNSKEGFICFQTLNDYYDENFENGLEYIVFGSDGAGNPFCINKINNNQIVLLDFDDEKIVSTNKNINDFLDSIFAYRIFINVIRSKYGAEALFHNLYREEDIEMLKQEFSKINADLLANSEFWKQEIDELIMNKNANSTS
ncbi:SMI1/KNR4 family protein [Sphingobacterium siyangense]|jgi:hypothetical protein|uniref:SMI1/KNR4 family protein n=1 Tax=Sphingobacterium siyangense TaxID=459529 RepID=UPI001963B682|nr:SMI1/KNR4 family protein [Sphingobacterium siyangense]QRY60406.1 SMI1/KNR4 family protein [Sphingobacterium siyangense]